MKSRRKGSVKKTRDKRDAGITLEESVRQAVDECIFENILTEFFTGHREEIVEMGIYEFDQELHDRILREDSMEMGVELGKKQGIELGKKQETVSLICKKLKRNKTLKEIADDLEEEVSVIESIYNIARKFAPDYDPELILKQINAD